MAAKKKIDKVRLNEILNKYYSVIAIGLVLIILGVAGALIIYPQYLNLVRVNDEQLASSEVDLTEKTTYLANLREMEKNFQDTNLENFRNLDKVLVREDDIPWLFGRVESMVQASNLKLLNMSYSKVQTGKTETETAVVTETAVAEPVAEETAVAEEITAQPTAKAAEKMPPGIGALTVNISVQTPDQNWGAFKRFLDTVESNIEIMDVKNISYQAGLGNYSLTFETYYTLQNYAKD